MSHKEPIPLYDLDQSIDQFKIYELKGRDNSPSDLPHLTTVPHRHNYFELIVFFTGPGCHLIDFKEWPIRSGSVHFVAPGQAHLIRRDEQCNGYLMTMSRRFLTSLLDEFMDCGDLPFYQYGCQPAIVLAKNNFEEIRELTLKINDLFRSGVGHAKELIKAYLNVIFLRCKNYHEELSESKTYNKNRYWHLFTRFQKKVEQQFKRSSEVNFYAEILSISPGHLNKICKQLTGRNASSHIRERLLLESKRLLAVTDLTQKEIADELGFSDIFHFNKYFKKHIGKTPGEFRHQTLLKLTTK